MRKLFLSLAVLGLVVVPALAGKYNKVIEVGQKAPAFSGIQAAIREADTVKDTTIDLDTIKDKVVVLVFLANHCPAVTQYEDRVIDLAKAYQGKPVKFVAVCVNDMDSDRLPAIKTRIKEKNYNFVYGYDDTQKIGRAYGATNTPQFFVLDETRTIRYTGALDDNMNEDKAKTPYLKNAVDALLAGESVEVPETRAIGCSIKYTK